MKQSLSGRIFTHSFYGLFSCDTEKREYDPLSLLKSGNEKAFRQFYHLHFQRLSFYAYRQTNRTDVAKDIAHETLAKVWERKSGFDSFNHIEAFMYRATKNACISWLRANDTSNRALGTILYLGGREEARDEWIDLEKLHTELIGKTYEMIDDLPDPGGQIIRASFLQGRSNQEIADQLAITANAVAVKKFRALTLLRSMMNRAGIRF